MPVAHKSNADQRATTLHSRSRGDRQKWPLARLTFSVKRFCGVCLQRFCQILHLRPDPALTAEYTERHKQVWPEVLESLRAAGVLDMEIYLRGTLLVTIMDTTDNFTFDRKAEMDRNHAIVMRWEREIARFQVAHPSVDAICKWQRMECVFNLKEQLA